MNDMELTEQRYKEFKENGNPIGLVIWVVRDRHNSILGMFASKKHAEELIAYYDGMVWTRLDMFQVGDIKNIAMEVDD